MNKINIAGNLTLLRILSDGSVIQILIVSVNKSIENKYLMRIVRDNS